MDPTLLGEKLVLTGAPEPGEILWHNRHITTK
jgi:hypothetical protein